MATLAEIKQFEKESKEFNRKTLNLRMKLGLASPLAVTGGTGGLRGIPGVGDVLTQTLGGPLGGLIYGGQKGLMSAAQIRRVAAERQYSKQLGAVGTASKGMEAMLMGGRLMRIPTALALMGGMGFHTFGTTPMLGAMKGLGAMLGGKALGKMGASAGGTIAGKLGEEGGFLQTLLPSLLENIGGILPGALGVSGAMFGINMLKRKRLLKITAVRKSEQRESMKYSLSRYVEPHIRRLVTQGQLQPADQIKIQLLRWIEGHTSVLPVIHTEFEMQRQEKEKTVDPAIESMSAEAKGKSFSDVIMGGLSMALAKYDPFTQMSNFIFGGFKTPGQFKKELREQYTEGPKYLGRGKYAQETEEAFDMGFGVMVEHYQALKRKGSELVKAAASYEAKTLAIQVGQYEVQRVASMELVAIRKGGFGISNPFYYKERESLPIILAETVGKITDKIPGLSALASIAALPLLPGRVARRAAFEVRGAMQRWRQAGAAGEGIFGKVGAFLSRRWRAQEDKDWQQPAFGYLANQFPQDIQNQLLMMSMQVMLQRKISESSGIVARHTFDIYLAADAMTQQLRAIRAAVGGQPGDFSPIVPGSTAANTEAISEVFDIGRRALRVDVVGPSAQHGAHVDADETVLVGEGGAEAFVPKTGGKILPITREALKLAAYNVGMFGRGVAAAGAAGARTLAGELGEVKEKVKEKAQEQWQTKVLDTLTEMKDLDKEGRKQQLLEWKYELKEKAKALKTGILGKIMEFAKKLPGGMATLKTLLGIAGMGLGIASILKFVDWLQGDEEKKGDEQTFTDKVKKGVSKYFKGEGFWSNFPAWARWGVVGAAIGGAVTLGSPMGVIGGGLVVGSLGSWVEGLIKASEAPEGQRWGEFKDLLIGKKKGHSFWGDTEQAIKYGVPGALAGWSVFGPLGAIAGGMIGMGLGFLIRDAFVGAEEGGAIGFLGSLFTGDGKGGIWNAMKGAPKGFIPGAIAGAAIAAPTVVGAPVGALIGGGLGALFMGAIGGLGNEGMAKFNQWMAGSWMLKHFKTWNETSHKSASWAVEKIGSWSGPVGFGFTLTAGVLGGIIGTFLDLIKKINLKTMIESYMLANWPRVSAILGITKETTAANIGTQGIQKLQKEGRVGPTDQKRVDQTVERALVMQDAVGRSEALKSAVKMARGEGELRMIVKGLKDGGMSISPDDSQEIIDRRRTELFQETGGTANDSIKTKPPVGSSGYNINRAPKASAATIGSIFESSLTSTSTPSDEEFKDPTHGGDAGHDVDAEAAIADSSKTAVGVGLNTLVWGKGVDRRVDKRLLKIWANIQYEAGYGPLTITSGYRDPLRNTASGGAKRSYHMKGQAIDVRVAHLTRKQRLRLIAIASKHGIGGIGVYNTALHFDIGPRRAWGPCYRSHCVPAWSAKAIQDHLGNKYNAKVAHVAEISPTAADGGAAGAAAGGGVKFAGIRQMLKQSAPGEFFSNLWKSMLGTKLGGSLYEAAQEGMSWLTGEEPGGSLKEGKPLTPLSAEEKAAWEASGYGQVGPIKALIIKKAREHGVDPKAALAIAFSESGFNPSARAPGSTAAGLYQILKGTAIHEGFDYSRMLEAEYAAEAGTKMLAGHQKFLEDNNLPVSPGTIYMAHFLGRGGARATLRGNPNYMHHFRQMKHYSTDTKTAMPVMDKRIAQKYAASMSVMADYGGVNISGQPMNVFSAAKEAFVPLEDRDAMKKVGQSLVQGLKDALMESRHFVGDVKNIFTKVEDAAQKVEQTKENWKEEALGMMQPVMNQQYNPMPPDMLSPMKQPVKSDVEPGTNVKTLDNSVEALIRTLFKGSSAAFLYDLKEYALDSNFMHDL